ncbi:MAG: hypothetical protein RL071_3862 [Pseudomonadota bacterium]|jgi:hypothetical protein
MRVMDCEERYNAAHGRMLADGHWDAILALQYRRFCGGCTAVSALAGLLFSAAPRVLLTWKLVPVGFCCAIAVVGLRLAWAQAGRRAALLFLALACLPPLNALKLGLLAWGNHMEAGLFGLLLLGGAARARPIWLGLIGGFALWFGFSSVPALLALLGGLLLSDRRRLLRLLPGLLLAPALWLLQLHQTRQHPFGHIYSPGEAIPALSRLPDKLMTLAAPQQWAGLFALPAVELGLPLGAACLAALLAAGGLAGPGLGLRARRWLLVWLGCYLLVGFRLELLPWPAVSSAAGLRYAGPTTPIWQLMLAIAGARLWGGGRRGAAALLVAPALLAGLLSRAASLSPPWPDAAALALAPEDAAFARYPMSYALPLDAHAACAGGDAAHQATHAYARGRAAALGRSAAAPLDDLAAVGPEPAAFWQGVGEALIDAQDSDARGDLRVLAALEERLSVLPAPARAEALAAAVWWRAFREEPHGFARGPAGEARGLRRLAEAAAPLSPTLRAAALRSLGRRWGLVRGRWAQPGPVDGLLPWVPGLEDDAREAFVEGLGEGLGEKWGPVEGEPLGAALSRAGAQEGALRAAFARGLATGAARAWTPGAPVAPVRAEAAAPRWWGPAPTMYCPCDATCW